MIKRELRMHFIAYDIIRSVVQKKTINLVPFVADPVSHFKYFVWQLSGIVG